MKASILVPWKRKNLEFFVFDLPKVRNCLNFGVLEGEKPRVFDPGSPKVRNCLNLGALEGKKPRVFEPGPSKVRKGLKKTNKTIPKIPNPREGLKKTNKTNGEESWAWWPGPSKIETLTRICKFGQKSVVFLTSRAPKIETFTRIAKVNFQILVRVSIF